MFQQHEYHAAELLPVVTGDDGLLVGLGDGHRISETQLALLHQHGVAERQKLRILGQPLLAGGEPQGEAGSQVAGLIQGRVVSRFQQQLEELSVVEAGDADAGRQLGMAGGAQVVAVAVALVAEREAQGSGHLGGAGP